MIKVKQCTRCGEVKSIYEFSKHRRSPDGHAWQCKTCGKKRGKLFRQTPAGIYNNIQGRSNFYKGRPLKISKDDFIEWYVNEIKVCAYCGIPEIGLHNWGDTVNGRTSKLNIDRVVNPEGYAEGNLVLCCQRCNYIKSDFFTYDEMREIGQKYVKPRWKKESAKNE